MQHLECGKIHVWWTDFDCGSLPQSIRTADVLDDDEIRRMEKYIFHEDRNRFATSHTILRFLLSEYSDIAPRDWVFSYNDHGRPEISPHLASQLRFNLSHTNSAIAIAIARTSDIGVDVAGMPAQVDETMIRRVLSPEEIVELSETHTADRRHLFIKYWTLKEAYTKALGLGMSMPFSKLTFRIMDEGQENITLLTHDSCCTDDWYFYTTPLPCGHQLSAAAKKASSPLSFDINKYDCNF